ncbi:MAG TPA: type II secretion system F family protein, partial [Methanolinea sp.]|nr:type II secretion system F family protein [Methanolinea sp.]
MIFNALIRRRIQRNPLRYQDLQSELISTRAGLTLERYLIRSMEVALLAGAGFAVLGYILTQLLVISAQSGGYIHIYNVFNLPIPGEIDPLAPEMLGIKLAGAIIAFILGSLLVYLIALKYPGMQKGNRATKINLTLHNAVAYMYAMRKGGAQLMTIFRSLSENSKIYGEVALEFRQVVRDADFFGYDVVSAIRHLMETTPSEKLKQFLEDMVSVIESGGDLVSFLSGRVRLYQEEARFEQ